MLVCVFLRKNKQQKTNKVEKWYSQRTTFSFSLTHSLTTVQFLVQSPFLPVGLLWLKISYQSSLA